MSELARSDRDVQRNWSWSCCESGHRRAETCLQAELCCRFYFTFSLLTRWFYFVHLQRISSNRSKLNWTIRTPRLIFNCGPEYCEYSCVFIKTHLHSDWTGDLVSTCWTNLMLSAHYIKHWIGSEMRQEVRSSQHVGLMMRCNSTGSVKSEEHEDSWIWKKTEGFLFVQIQNIMIHQNFQHRFSHKNTPERTRC